MSSREIKQTYESQTRPTKVGGSKLFSDVPTQIPSRPGFSYSGSANPLLPNMPHLSPLDLG